MWEEILHFVEEPAQFSKLFCLNQVVPLVIYSSLLLICSRSTKNLWVMMVNAIVSYILWWLSISKFYVIIEDYYAWWNVNDHYRSLFPFSASSKNSLSYWGQYLFELSPSSISKRYVT